MAFKFPDKDPDEKLDYTVDWSRYLGDSLTIASALWYIVDSNGDKLAFTTGKEFVNDAITTSSGSSTGLVCSNADVLTDTTCTIVLDKGIANTTYTLVNQITTTTSSKTSAAIVTDRKIKIKVRERI